MFPAVNNTNDISITINIFGNILEFFMLSNIQYCGVNFSIFNSIQEDLLTDNPIECILLKNVVLIPTMLTTRATTGSF